MSYKLTIAKAASTAFGAAIEKSAAVQREFCIRLTEEVLSAPLQIEAIFDAAKAAAKYDRFEYSSDQALFRKQLSYVRQIAAAWDGLTDGQRESFTGGSLPASSLVKEIKAPAAEKAEKAKAEKAKAAKEQAEKEQEALDRNAPRVVTPAEMMVHVSAMLDSRELAGFTEAESKAYAMLRDAMKAAEAQFVETASKTLAA